MKNFRNLELLIIIIIIYFKTNFFMQLLHLDKNKNKPKLPSGTTED